MGGSVDKYRTPQGRTRWRARWDLPPGPDGERRRQTKAGFTTKADANRHLRETLAAIDRGATLTGTDVTLAAHLRRWLDGKRIRPTTRDNYSVCIEIHTIPRIGGLALSEVDHHVLNRLYRDLEAHGKAAPQDPSRGITTTCRTAGITCTANGCAPDRHAGLSVTSVQHVHGTLRSALHDAVRDNLIARNPADLASPPRRSAGQRRVTPQQVWTPDQARRFLTHVRADLLGPLWALGLATGMRRGELAALTWPAVDLTTGILEVRASTTTVRGTDVHTTGKTDAARRRLHLDRTLTHILQRQRARQHELGTLDADQHVFTDEHGQRIRPQRLTTTFRRIALAAGVPNIGVHGLRHTAATLMLNNGVPIHIVANRLGHSDAATTLAIYSHVMPNDDQVAATAMANILWTPQPARQPERGLDTGVTRSLPPPAPPTPAPDRYPGLGF